MKSSASTKSKRDCSGTVARQIKEKARTIGFDLVGISNAQPQHTPEFQQWLISGFHGEMGYMARNAEKRVDPSKILADVQSVVVVGLNYNTDDHGNAPHPSFGHPLPAGWGEGKIARYAWGTRDYHDVMSEKLKQLAVGHR